MGKSRDGSFSGDRRREAEEPAGVGLGHAGCLFSSDLMQCGYFSDGIRDKGRFIPASALRYRRQIGAVSLCKNPIHGDRGAGVLNCNRTFKCHISVNADHSAGIKRFFGHLSSRGEAVKNKSRFPGIFGFQDIDRFRLRVPCMDDERLPEALRGLNMAEKPLDLPRAGGLCQ